MEQQRNYITVCARRGATVGLSFVCRRLVCLPCPSPGAAGRSDGSGPPGAGRGCSGRSGLVSVAKIFWIASHPLGILEFSGDIQAPPGQGPLQPALGDPAWAGGWTGWPTELPSNPCHAGILGFNGDSELSTASMQIIREYRILGGIELSGADPRRHSPCAGASQISPRLGRIQPCAAAAGARGAGAGRTAGKGGLKAFLENSAWVLRPT